METAKQRYYRKHRDRINEERRKQTKTPEYKAKRKEYRSRPEVKAKRKEYDKKYMQRPEVKEKYKIRNQTIKAKINNKRYRYSAKGKATRAKVQKRYIDSLKAKGVKIIYKSHYQKHFLPLYEEQKGLCNFCGVKPLKLEIDHIVPQQVARDIYKWPEKEIHKKENLQLLCSKCNGMKGNKLLTSKKDFLSFFKKSEKRG